MAKIPVINKKAIGTPVEANTSMSKTFVRKTLIIVGIMVAFLVIAIYNISLHASSIAEIEKPGNKLQEVVHFAIPNVIFFLF